MAIPIKAVPILSGEIADNFIREAEKNEQNPASGLSAEHENQVSQVLSDMNSFKFPWDKE